VINTPHVPLADDLLASAVNHDPHPHFRALREHDPVHWSERHRAWLLTRYQDCCSALMNPQALSSDRVRPLLEVLIEERRAAAAPVYELISGWMVVTDPPEHRRLRNLVVRAFNPRRVAAMVQTIQELVDALLDEFVAAGHEDLIANFTYPLPATVIARIIGAPPQDGWRFHEWSEALGLLAFGAGGDERGERYGRALNGLEQMFGYLDDLIDRRRDDPGGDMISDLIAGAGEDRLSDEEVKGLCALMLFAGHETTTSAIASAVLMLLEHPDQLQALRARPDELAASAVEEALRYEGPIKVLHRWVKSDIELGGREIREGERVLVLVAAANRDPERFPGPDGVDIARHPNPHIAFGRGIHACVGAQLARLEMRLAVTGIVIRLPRLRLARDAAELRWTPSLVSRGLAELPVCHEALR
jgi:cytochrome P450